MGRKARLLISKVRDARFVDLVAPIIIKAAKQPSDEANASLILFGRFGMQEVLVEQKCTDNYVK